MNDRLNSDQPLVSVVLPVFNGADYLRESIGSILLQSYRNFELIVVNDGSTDESEKVVRSFDDPRIRYYHQSNAGLAVSLNNGIASAKGIYIARQDHDDLSCSDRLEKQVRFMESNRDIVLLGARARIFSDKGEMGIHNHATEPAELTFDLLFDNPFVHSSVMFRREDFFRAGGYSTDRSFFEDYDLWSRLAEAGKVANLPDVLVEYRHHDQGLSKGTAYYREYAAYRQSKKNIERLMGESSDIFTELAAVFHWHTAEMKGTGRAELLKALHLIAMKLVVRFPENRRLIMDRAHQYRKVISYRINIIQRRAVPKHTFRWYLLRLERIIMRYQPHVINR